VPLLIRLDEGSLEADSVEVGNVEEGIFEEGNFGEVQISRSHWPQPMQMLGRRPTSSKVGIQFSLFSLFAARGKYRTTQNVVDIERAPPN